MGESEKINNIKIYIGQSLSTDDMNVLTTLYMPIMGTTAYSIYMFFYSILDRKANMKEIPLKSLLKILSITEKTFAKERIKIEAIGLMNTYVKDDEAVFLLKAPLSSKSFIGDPLLNLNLINKVGDETHDMLINSFRVGIFNKEGYVNVTSKFKEAFSDSIDRILKKEDGLFIDKVDNKSVKLDEYIFNFDEFLSKANLDFQECNNITADFQKLIEETAFYYDLNEEEMARAYVNSLSLANEFTISNFSKSAKEVRNKKTLQYYDDLVSYERMRYMSIEVLLKLLCPKAIKADYNTVKKIMRVSPLSEEITKMAVAHALLKYNNGHVSDDDTRCPELAYFQKALETFEKFGIKDFESAFKFVYEQHIMHGVKKQNTNNRGYDDDLLLEDEWLKDFNKRNA